jgi:hypothetical protein
MKIFMDQYQRYSTDIKYAIAKSGDINLFPELDIPKSTAQGWVKRVLSATVRDLIFLIC